VGGAAESLCYVEGIADSQKCKPSEGFSIPSTHYICVEGVLASLTPLSANAGVRLFLLMC